MTHEFQADGPGVIGSDLCQVCGKEQYEHAGELPSLKQICVLMKLQREASGYHDLKSKWDAAINEAHCCDDINLDQPLAGIIADLQKDRERLWDENKNLKAALSVDEQKAKAMGENF